MEMTMNETIVQTVRDAANLFCSEAESFIDNSTNVAPGGQVNIVRMSIAEEAVVETVTVALYGIGATILGADLHARLVALKATLDVYQSAIGG
jgi:hypothetical protein